MSKNSAGGCLIFRQSAIADHLDADASTLIAADDQCLRCAAGTRHHISTHACLVFFKQCHTAAEEKTGCLLGECLDKRLLIG